MDNATLKKNLDRILTLRGDPAHGLPATAWQEALEGTDPTLLLRAAIACVRELLVPEWASRRKDDKRPQTALEAAEMWLANNESPEAIAALKAAAKACTAARNETFGDDHRVPQAARSVAWSAGGKDPTEIFNAFSSTEDELLTRINLTAEYHRGPEQRRAIVATITKVIMPPDPAAEKPAQPRVDAAPVPYSAEGHFELGQRILHKKFGEISVTAVGETWIEVEVEGAKKRLAHKP